MYKDFYANSDLLNWPVVAMAIFFVTFVLVLLYVFVGLRGGKRLESVASLPLEDDTTAPAGEASNDE